MREAESQDFEPSIEVTIDDEEITVVDNGIGMTPEEIERNFWWAGRSGKNTEAARAAGVVGTFGIGALANFGVADSLSVESESALTGERTRSAVRKSELSTETEGISVTPMESYWGARDHRAGSAQRQPQDSDPRSSALPQRLC